MVDSGADFGKQYALPKPKPARVSPWELECRACGKHIEPEDAFERELRFFSGVEEDRDELRMPPPDPWLGKNVLSGGVSSEQLIDLIRTDADVRRQMEDDPLWARRETAKAVLNDIPLGLHYRLIRALVLPCEACGEADPLGIG